MHQLMQRQRYVTVRSSITVRCFNIIARFLLTCKFLVLNAHFQYLEISIYRRDLLYRQEKLKRQNLMKKKNKKSAGKVPKEVEFRKNLSRRVGGKTLPAQTKKQKKKAEQRARLAAKAAPKVANAMEVG